MHKTKAILIICLLLISSKVWSNPENFSITDFTMHKVAPVQGEPEVKPSFESNLKKEAPKKSIKPVQKTDKKVQKTVKKEVKSDIKTTKSEPKPVVKDEKPEIKVVITDIKEAQVDAKEMQPEFEQKKEEKQELFNGQNLVDNLNSYLEQEEIAKTFPQSPEKSKLKTYNHYDYIIKPTVSLGIVLVLIFIFAWLYNKLRGINPNALLSGKFSDMDVNKFTVLASSSLGQGKIIHLVEINGKQLVVGSTNNNISLLTEISPEDMEKLQAKAEKKRKPASAATIEPEQSDEFENVEPDSYSAKYSNVYKDYIE